MVLSSSDLKMFLTGGTTNTNPALSRGGNVSSTEVITDTVNNLFRRITESEASSGVTIYRCVALKNMDAGGATMRNVRFYMVLDTTSPDDLASYSYAQADKNTVETATADEFTAPTGSKINFISARNRSGGLVLGDLAPNDYINVWLRYTANPGARIVNENSFKVRAEFNNPNSSGPSSGGGDGGGPTPDPDPDTGVNFTMACVGDISCGSAAQKNVDSIKKRKTGFVVWNGDLAYSGGEKCFITMVKNAGYGKSASTISFGNHDVDEGSDANGSVNALKGEWGMSKTYFSKTFKSVGIVVMEGGENESVSSSGGGTQYNAVKQMLTDMKANSGIEWIFVFNHYPIYGPSSDHGNDSGVRDDYDPLFDTYGVDAVFTSHNHIMWHTKLLKYNSGSPGSPTASGTDPNYSYNRATSNHGKLYIGTGAGGKSHYSLGSLPSYVPFGNNKVYGYIFMEFSTNGKKCTFKFYDSSDNLLKTFTVTHT